MVNRSSRCALLAGGTPAVPVKQNAGLGDRRSRLLFAAMFVVTRGGSRDSIHPALSTDQDLMLLHLLNQRSLGGPDHPAAIAFDEGVGEASAAVKRHSLIVFPAHMIDAGNDGRISIDACG